MASRQTRLKFAAIAISLLLLAAALEAAVRIYESLHPPYRAFDPRLGFRYRADTTVTVYSDESGRDIELSFNGEGFRDVDHEVNKPDGVSRILFLGDSFISATQVDFDDSFHRRLQRRLDDLRPGAFEVMNLGVSGYGTVQALAAFEHIGRKYAPDIVVLGFFLGNDVGNNHRPLSGEGRVFFDSNPDGSLGESTTRAVNIYGDHALARHSRLYRLVMEKIEKLREKYVYYTRTRSLVHRYNVFLEPPPAEWEQAWRVTEAVLARLRERVEATGARFVLLVIPDAIQIYPSLWEHAMRNEDPERLAALNPALPTRRLKTIADTHRLDVIDLAEIIASDRGERPLYFGRAHFNLHGHELVSQALMEGLAPYLAIPR